MGDIIKQSRIAHDARALIDISEKCLNVVLRSADFDSECNATMG